MLYLNNDEKLASRKNSVLNRKLSNPAISTSVTQKKKEVDDNSKNESQENNPNDVPIESERPSLEMLMEVKEEYDKIKSNLAMPTISLDESSEPKSSSEKHKIFMAPQIILSYEEEISDNDGNSSSNSKSNSNSNLNLNQIVHPNPNRPSHPRYYLNVNSALHRKLNRSVASLQNTNSNKKYKISTKILYSSCSEDILIGEEHNENTFKDLNKIINFGDEQEPETNGLSVMRSVKHNEVIKDDENLEQKRLDSIKYADSGVNFKKYANNTNEETTPENESTPTTPVGSSSSKNPSPKIQSPKTGNDIRIPSPKSLNDSRNPSPKSGSDTRNPSPKSGSDTRIQSPRLYVNSINIVVNDSLDVNIDDNNSESEEGRYEGDSLKPLRKDSLSAPQIIDEKRGRRYSTMMFNPIKDAKITGDVIGKKKELPKNFLKHTHLDVSNQNLSKFGLSVKEFIPQRGLLYSEFQQFDSGWVLCKPKLLPLKSIDLQKIEKMEDAVYKTRQTTAARLTRTASVHTSQPIVIYYDQRPEIPL